MKAKLIFAAAAVALTALAACGAKDAGRFTLSVDLNPDANDRMAYLTDYDTTEPIDSVRVADGRALFSGTVAEPLIARITLGDTRVGTLILEPGTLVFDTQRRTATGSPLNERLNAINDSLQAVVAAFDALPKDSLYAARTADLEARYNAIAQNALDDNTDNALGYYFFVNKVAGMTLPELNAELEKYPQWAQKSRVAAMKEALKMRHETSPGHRYKDFEVTYDGRTQRLSDYVKEGRYTLVDFWASWCGPCIREIKVLKELYRMYEGRLDIVGVAVWDEPAATEAAIRRLQIPWPCIVNAGTVPTDLYGIQGIPCIVLIGPDGTILSRDRQDADLMADVEAALGAPGQR